MSPNPAPRTIFPASQPATRPTTNMTRILSFDIYTAEPPGLLQIFYSHRNDPITNCQQSELSNSWHEIQRRFPCATVKAGIY